MPFKDHDLNQALNNLREMEKEVEELLKDFFLSKNQTLMVSENGWTPHIDMYETSNAFIVKVELSGVNKNDVKVQLTRRILIISGIRFDKPDEDRKHFNIAEIAYGKFIRKVELPTEVDENNIVAQFEDGYLKISISKAKKDKFSHVIIPITDE